MPTKPLKQCANSNCNNLSDQNYCIEHRKEADSLYIQHRTASGRSVYDTQWKLLSKSYITLHPLCVVCGEIAKDVDHIIPVRIAPEKMYDVSNLQSMCHKCHSKKSKEEKQARDNTLL